MRKYIGPAIAGGVVVVWAATALWDIHRPRPAVAVEPAGLAQAYSLVATALAESKTKQQAAFAYGYALSRYCGEGFPTDAEVRRVEKAAEDGKDTVWIHTRTCAFPFRVAQHGDAWELQRYPQPHY